MSKKTFISMSAVLILSASAALASEVQSPIYTDDIGRMHFMGKGGYSNVRQLQMGEMQAGAVDDAVIKYSNDTKKVIDKTVEEAKAEVQTVQTELDITNVIKEKPVVPAAAHKSSFLYQKGGMDASNPHGFAGTNIPSGVNDSKTIYKDDLGRLHFFGKANQIRE